MSGTPGFSEPCLSIQSFSPSPGMSGIVSLLRHDSLDEACEILRIDFYALHIEYLHDVSQCKGTDLIAIKQSFYLFKAHNRIMEWDTEA